MNEGRYSAGLVATAMLYGFCCSCSDTTSPERVPPVSTLQVAAKPVPVAVVAPATRPSPVDWPRRFDEADNSFAVYQPQIDSWEGDQLQARSAVSVTPKGTKEPRVGVIWLEARTDVDKPARMVTLDAVKVTKASFPQDESTTPVYVEAIRKHVSSAAREVPLDLLETNLAASTAAKAGAAVEVKNDPPRILFVTVPTLLVLIDGEPVLFGLGAPGGAPATATGAPAPSPLKRVVNTRALMLFDEAAGRYYLHAMNAWVSAASPEGPWSPVPAADVPPPVDAAKLAFAKDPTVDLLEPATPEVAPKQPAVITSTQPAELIQTRGAMEFAPLPGTNLEHVSNTDAAVFRHVPTQKYYVLVSGRWFSAASVEGPWAFVAGKDLPQDFQKIPPDGPKANVLVSVPGTPQAQEALIANSIPQTAAVKISEASLTVTYDGEPKFKPIAGTKGLQYATNTKLPVILIEADRTYWCVENGIWFTAGSPAGPWAVATTVPGVIYTIPASHPLHYVTYVRVYGTAPGVVYVGYTPGYMGTCVSSGGVVVYGTGYSYPAYVGTVWVGYPPTYGYGAGFSYGAAGGFAFGFAAGAMVGGCWSQPYWGAYHGGGYRYGDVDINSSNVYRNARGGVTSVNRHYGYDWEDNRTNVSGRGKTFNPYSNKVGVGGYSGHYDWDNNEYKMNRAGASYDRDTNDVRMAGSKITGDVDEGTKTVKRGAAEYDRDTGVVKGGGAKTKIDQEAGTIDRETGQFRYNTNTGTGVARKGDDLYIGQDDNVYRRTDEGWQQKTDDGWKDAQRDPGASTQTRDLDRQKQSRDVGTTRYNNYQQSGATRSGYAGAGNTSAGTNSRNTSRSGSSPSYRGSSGTPSRSSPAPSRSGGYGGGRGGGGGGRGGGGRR